MNRFIITIRPSSSDDGVLSVADAMLQVIDALKVFEAAEQSFGSPHDAFEWKLEKASTNSPFTVVARAEAFDPAINISLHVSRVKAEVSRGFHTLISERKPAPWMKPEVLKTVRGMLARNLNGIGHTDIDFEADAVPVLLDYSQASEGIQALEAINAIDTSDLPERESYGELTGMMIQAGRHNRRPSVTIFNDLYGFIPCVLSDDLVRKFGDQRNISDIWKGKTLAVKGNLFYGKGGKLTRIEAGDVAYVEVPYVELRDVQDSDFTAGLDPIHYLDLLHAGGLA